MLVCKLNCSEMVQSIVNVAKKLGQTLDHIVAAIMVVTVPCVDTI